MMPRVTEHPGNASVLLDDGSRITVTTLTPDAEGRVAWTYLLFDQDGSIAYQGHDLETTAGTLPREALAALLVFLANDAERYFGGYPDRGVGRDGDPLPPYAEWAYMHDSEIEAAAIHLGYE